MHSISHSLWHLNYLLETERESKNTIMEIKTHSCMDFDSSLSHDIMIYLYFYS